MDLNLAGQMTLRGILLFRYILYTVYSQIGFLLLDSVAME